MPSTVPILSVRSVPLWQIRAYSEGPVRLSTFNCRLSTSSIPRGLTAGNIGCP